MRFFSRTILVLVAGVATLVISACQTAVTVGVQVNEDGSGTVTVELVVDRQAMQGITDVNSLLSVDDLASRGWSASGPSFTPEGSDVSNAESATWSISKPFASPTEFAAIMSELGVVSAVELKADAGRFSSSVDVGVTVDLSHGFAAFGDEQLSELTGSPIGIDPQKLLETTGLDVNTATALTLEFQMPGNVEETNAVTRDENTLSWPLTVGTVTDASASSSDRNTSTYIALLGFVVFTVLAVIAWRVSARSARSSFGSHRRGRGGW